MTVLLFEYSHTSIGSWDRKWSGSGKVYAKEVNLTKGLKEHLEALGIDCGNGKNHTFHYDFKDGWACNVTMIVGTKTEFKEIMKHSQGFLGYDWMIDSILKYGRILDPSLMNQSEPAGIVGNIHIESGFGTQNQDEYFTPILSDLKAGKYNKCIVNMKPSKNKASASICIDGDQLQADVEHTGFSIDQFLNWLDKNEAMEEFEFLISDSKLPTWEVAKNVDQND